MEQALWSFSAPFQVYRCLYNSGDWKLGHNTPDVGEQLFCIMPQENIWKGIKMSSSESRPRKVKLTSAHKNVTTTVSILHITMEFVNTPTKEPYTLVNGLYKITIESIKLVLDVDNIPYGTKTLR